MEMLTNFSLCEALWRFGRLPSDRLPEAACKALEEGYDCEELYELAGMPQAPNPDLHRLFEKALAVIGRPVMSKTDAGRILGVEYARRILAGQLTPIEGASEIWRLHLDSRGQIEEFEIFEGLAGDYEDLPHMRAEIDDQIRQEAQRLCAQAAQ